MAQYEAALEDAQGGAGLALELRDVFLREDEILSSDGPAAVARLTVLMHSMRTAVLAGACIRAAEQNGCQVGARADIDRQLDRAAKAAVQGREDLSSLLALRQLWTELRAACAPSLEAMR